MRKNHPWRAPSPGVQTIDPIVHTRSSRFAEYLSLMLPADRRQIEVSERAYVHRSGAATSPQQSTARDFAEGMLGTIEDVRRLERGRGLT